VTLEVGVNGTRYALQIRLMLRPPTVTFDFNTVTFTDRRSVRAEVSCRTPIGRTSQTVEVLEVSGTLRYTDAGREARGTIRVKAGGSEYAGTYTGYLAGERGNVTISAAGWTMYVDFTTSLLAVTKVVINGQPWTALSTRR